MADGPDNLVLQYLRRMDQKIDRLLEEQSNHRVRLTRLDEGFAGVKTEIAGLHGDFASLSVRLDRVNDRLDRIEKRLDLVEAPPTPF